MSELNFFDSSYVSSIDNETRGTSIKKQIDFLFKHIQKNKNIELLDQCCGHGRHLAQLQKKGYLNLTGIDINEYFVDKARQSLGMNVKLYCSDVFEQKINKRFDLILNMESSINSFSKESLNRLIKFNYELIKEKGIVIIHSFNPFYVDNLLPKKTWHELKSGNVIIESRRIDSKNSILDITQIRMSLCNNGEYRRENFKIRQTLHSKSEIASYVVNAGFQIKGIYGDFNGSVFKERESKNLIFVLKRRYT